METRLEIIIKQQQTLEMLHNLPLMSHWSSSSETTMMFCWSMLADWQCTMTRHIAAHRAVAVHKGI